MTQDTTTWVARESRNLSVKQVAATLRVPQYRLKAIEQGNKREVQGEILENYAAFLGLTPWLRRWAAANRALASELGLTMVHRTRRASRKPLHPSGTTRNGRRPSRIKRSRSGP